MNPILTFLESIEFTDKISTFDRSDFHPALHGSMIVEFSGSTPSNYETKVYDKIKSQYANIKSQFIEIVSNNIPTRKTDAKKSNIVKITFNKKNVIITMAHNKILFDVELDVKQMELLNNLKLKTV